MVFYHLKMVQNEYLVRGGGRKKELKKRTREIIG